MVLSPNFVFWCSMAILTACVLCFAVGYHIASVQGQKAINWSGYIWHRTAPDILKASSKVTPLYPHIGWWKAGKGTEICKTPPMPGQTYAVRKTTRMPNGYLGIQLVGVTVSQGGNTWEPYWNASAFSSLESEFKLK